MRGSTSQYSIPALVVGLALIAILATRGEGTVASTSHSVGFVVYDLPAPYCAARPPVSDGLPRVNLNVRGGGALDLNGDRVTLDQLNASTAGIYQKRFGKVLFVTLAGGTYQDLINALDEIASLDLRVFALTDRSEKEYIRNQETCGYQLEPAPRQHPEASMFPPALR